jgi:hypothetical protein
MSKAQKKKKKLLKANLRKQDRRRERVALVSGSQPCSHGLADQSSRVARTATKMQTGRQSTQVQFILLASFSVSISRFEV